MAVGRGKYNAEAEAILKETQARGVVVLVFDGTKGSGMSCVCETELLRLLPGYLRSLSQDIEEEIKQDLSKLEH